MRAMMIAILMVVAGFPSVTGAQQLYKWVDADGKITYSDVPPPKDAKNVQQKAVTDSGPAVADVPYAVKIAMERNPVVLFANTCGELCDSARALLRNRGIVFADRNPEREPGALEALKAAAGSLEVPVLMVGTTVQRGFSADEWNAALTAGGYPRTNPNLRPSPAAPAAAAAPSAPPAPPTPSTPPEPPRSYSPGK